MPSSSGEEQTKVPKDSLQHIPENVEGLCYRISLVKSKVIQMTYNAGKEILACQ